ncbi:MAG TPA: DUF302 domain-containing protein [Ornithinibacter sp.]|nr:DUF302 domain-containing protein [Ornithinibacter sp.]
MGYALTTTVDEPFADVLDAVRAALGEQGFGVLTEIDLAATLREKIGAEIDPQVILGACRPPLAHAAVQAEPSIGLLLPCNVVVREVAEGGVVVEALNPDVMVELTHNEALADLARDAKERLSAALATLTG